MKPITKQVSLEIEDCCVCGGPIALTETMLRVAQENHSTFYCPVGHQNYYPGKSEAEELREKLKAEQEKAQILAHKLELTEHWAEEGRKELAKAKKRAHAGVCPECNRTFQNVSRHMQSKHKEAKR